MPPNSDEKRKKETSEVKISLKKNERNRKFINIGKQQKVTGTVTSVMSLLFPIT